MGTKDENWRKGGTWERRGANVAVSTDNGGEAGEKGFPLERRLLAASIERSLASTLSIPPRLVPLNRILSFGQPHSGVPKSERRW
jgi:hypothetical protein